MRCIAALGFLSFWFGFGCSDDESAVSTTVSGSGAGGGAGVTVSSASSGAGNGASSGRGGMGGEGGSSVPCLACERVIFITGSEHGAGSMVRGIEFGDVECNAAARSGAPRVVGRTFRAWLSSETESAAMRLIHGTGRYVLADGVTIVAE